MDTATFGWTSPPPPSAGLVYNGVWNAFTNNPFLQSGVGVNGEYYIVSVAGTTDLDGVTDWQVGDWAIFNGTDWQKIDNTDSITGSGTANEIAYWFSANQLGSLTVSTYPSLTELSYVKGVTSAIQTQFSNKVPYTGATSNVDIGLHDFTAGGSVYASTFNAVVITPPLGSATLTISDGKTLTVSNNANVSGTNTGDQNLSALAPLASPTFTGTVTSPAIVLSSETASTIASFDASKNVKSLDTTTYPSLTELSYVKGVTSAIQTQFANVGEWIQLGGTSLNPVDSTTYNFGLFNQLPPATTTGAREFSFIKTGTVTRFIFTVAMTIAGTAENVAVSLRNITTATDNSIGNITMSAGANGTGVFNFTPSITIANTTDRYTIKFVCPAWVTNPTGVYTSVRLFNKY